MKKMLLMCAVLVGLQAHQSVKEVFGDVSVLSQNVEAKISGWLHDNNDIISALIIQEGGLSEYIGIHKKNNELLQSKNIVNKSRSNYVFECPADPDYMIKISGPANRFVNMLVTQGFWPSTITDEEIKAVKKMSTVQTVSAFPTYLLFVNADKKVPFKNLFIPETYLLHVPGAPDALADTSYIVVQKKVKGQRLEDLSGLHDEELSDLVRVICECGIWDVRGKIARAEDGRIVLVDLEQPNVSDNAKGFNVQQPDRFKQNIECGLNDLKKMLTPEQIKFVETLVK